MKERTQAHLTYDGVLEELQESVEFTLGELVMGVAVNANNPGQVVSITREEAIELAYQILARWVHNKGVQA